MTDREIIQTLELCSSSKCDDCYYCNTGIPCLNLYRQARDLIKRQQAEIDYWKSKAFDGCMEKEKIYKDAISEAIKGFVVKLKKHACSYDLDNHHWFEAIELDVVDEVAKEFLGE